MPTLAKDLWSLALDHQEVDPADLAQAIEEQILSGDLDFRSRLLIRDSIDALRAQWSEDRFNQWLANSPIRKGIECIWRDEELGSPGFRYLRSHVVEITRPETIRQFLRELGWHVHKPTRIDVGGSIALIMKDFLARRTEDMDVVDEVPADLRNQHKLLHELKERYGLELAHFQRHYLPKGWENRLHYLDAFGALRVYLVDAHDVFLSKLFSKRTKDLDDLRFVSRHLDKAVLARKLTENCSALLSEQDLRQYAEKNWYIVYGEPLPA